jgi:hypothetical protein
MMESLGAQQADADAAYVIDHTAMAAAKRLKSAPAASPPTDQLLSARAHRSNVPTSAHPQLEAVDDFSSQAVPSSIDQHDPTLVNAAAAATGIPLGSQTLSVPQSAATQAASSSREMAQPAFTSTAVQRSPSASNAQEQGMQALKAAIGPITAAAAAGMEPGSTAPAHLQSPLGAGGDVHSASVPAASNKEAAAPQRPSNCSNTTNQRSSNPSAAAPAAAAANAAAPFSKQATAAGVTQGVTQSPSHPVTTWGQRGSSLSLWTGQSARAGVSWAWAAPAM